MSDLSLDDINAELARRGDASGAPSMSGIGLDDINAELARRASAEPQPPDMSLMPQPSAPPPTGPATIGLPFLDNLAAASQGASPNVPSAARLAPPDQQWALTETGKPLDEQKYVALRNPQTGQYSAYERSPDTAENPMAPLGRMLALGVPENLPTAVVPGAVKPAQSLLQDFDRVGVTPNLPAVGQSRVAGLVSQGANSLPLASMPVRAAANQTLGDTAAAAENLASAFGDARGPLDAGEAIQSGVNSFAKGHPPAGMSPSDIIAAPTRASGFGSKSAALYDRFEQSMDQTAPVSISNTLDALKGPMSRFPTSPELGTQLTNPKMQSFLETLKPGERVLPESVSSILDASGSPMVVQAAQKIQTGGTLTFPELSELRSTIGRAISDPGLINDIPRSDLKNLYGAISRDMESAAAQAGPDTLNAFRRANQYYKAGIDRIDQLEPLLKGSPEQAFAAINRAAGIGPGADAGKLVALSRSMPQEDWRDVAAAVIRRMGEPPPGAKDIVKGEFSPSSFATNWNKISDTGKDALFGASVPGSNREALDALARVAQAQKNVSRLANQSHSAEMVGLGAIGVAGAEHADALMAHPILAVTGALGAVGVGKALMSPGFARWLYQMPQMVTSAPNGAVGMQRSLAALDGWAQLNPELKPVADKLKKTLAPAE